jgi:hypothetical protein
MKGSSSSSELAGLLARCQTGITALFQQSSTLSERAARLAELLLELFPHAGLTACLLRGEGQDHLEIRPVEVPAGEKQKDFLRSRLASMDPLAAGVQMLTSGPPSGLRLLVTAIHEEHRPRGFLVIGLPAGAEAKEAARAEVLLTVAAPMLALRGAVEKACAEQAEMARFALIGQAFLGLAHDLNNALNSMMLQASVVQLRVDEATRQDLASVRQHGAQAAGVVRILQHVVQERREQSYPVDLGGALAAVLEESAELGRRVKVQPSRQAPSISSTRGAVKQLIQLLLQGVLAGTKSAVRLRTEQRGGNTELSMEIAEAVEEGSPPSVDALLWQNLDEVGRLAGQSLLRQLGGTVEVESYGKNGFILHVIWGS